MADPERILQQFHDSEINAGVQTFYDAGMRAWIGDEANGIQAETTTNRTASRVARRSRRRAGCMTPRYVCAPIANMPKCTAVDRQARPDQAANTAADRPPLGDVTCAAAT
jgi:hypothetical protein